MLTQVGSVWLPAFVPLPARSHTRAEPAAAHRNADARKAYVQVNGSRLGRNASAGACPRRASGRRVAWRYFAILYVPFARSIL